MIHLDRAWITGTTYHKQLACNWVIFRLASLLFFRNPELIFHQILILPNELSFLHGRACHGQTGHFLVTLKIPETISELIQASKREINVSNNVSMLIFFMPGCRILAKSNKSYDLSSKVDLNFPAKELIRQLIKYLIRRLIFPQTKVAQKIWNIIRSSEGCKFSSSTWAQT